MSTSDTPPPNTPQPLAEPISALVPPPVRGTRLLPVWGWLLLVGAVVLGSAIIVTGLFFAAGTMVRLTPSGPQAADSSQVDGALPLDSPTAYTQPPYWNSEPPTGWVTSPQSNPAQGIYIYANQNGCSLFLNQAILPANSQGSEITTDDTPATEAQLRDQISQVKEQADSSVVLDELSPVAISSERTDGPKLAYLSQSVGFSIEGQPFTMRFAMRAMPQAEGLMVIAQRCPESVNPVPSWNAALSEVFTTAELPSP
ncbi:hypothetical protein ODZ83_06525 [Acaricomes phytoseiuli]|uniref:hypothetical protein n=1 Tax=Acaricomes phytoseiuli TaxID=291968 RepID=UPI00037089A0|nr:hypothetical protein [Acaricomes phytoseiuli]MCW1249842.1 hypothetical protein [Acaricomes phytoseiuli]